MSTTTTTTSITTTTTSTTTTTLGTWTPVQVGGIAGGSVAAIVILVMGITIACCLRKRPDNTNWGEGLKWVPLVDRAGTAQPDNIKDLTTDINSATHEAAQQTTISSTSVSASSHFPARVTDCAAVLSSSSSPIYGIMVTPLFPLDIAMQHIERVIGSQVVKTAVWSATKFVSQTSPVTTTSLTPDMQAAINVYTQEGAVYRPLNDTLRNENRTLLKPYFPFLKLLLTGLDQLPSVAATVHRGVKLGLSDQYQIGATVTWWAFSSCTRDGNALQSDQFCGSQGQRTLFTVRCESGKDISSFSSFPNEAEVLLLPGTVLRVDSKMSSPGDPDLMLIHLSEEVPPSGVRLVS